MPDISMCHTTQCRKFKECYRAQAIPSEYLQSYCTFLQDTDEDKCDWFEEIKGDDRELVFVEK